MTDPVITCPNCKTEIKLTESLAAPYIEQLRKQHAAALAARQTEFDQREQAVRAASARIAEEKAALDRSRAEIAEQVQAQVARQVTAEKRAIEESALRKAREESSLDLQRQQKEAAELRERMKIQEAKLAEAQQAQADAMRMKQEAEDAKREIKVTVERQVNEQVAAKVATEKALIEDAALKRARAEAAVRAEQQNRETAELKERMRLQDAKLAEAQAAQAKAMQRERELDEQKRELELTIQRKVGESLSEVEARARQRADEENRLKLAEKDKMLADAQRRTEELQRRLEQGSQQLQGEVQELSLEAALRSTFPGDTIEEVGKGEHGGDAVHTVALPGGRAAGVILWESKRTERWTAGWLPKLRDDARTAGADIPVIVSRALPKEVETFGIVDGVWVCGWKYAVPLAMCLRQGLLAAAQAKQVQEGQQTKMGLVYEYLTGQGFRARLEAIVEAFGTMQEDLEKEKKAMLSQWSKRAKQLELAVGAATGMYGDVQGIVGQHLHQIEALEIKALGGPEQQ